MWQKDYYKFDRTGIYVEMAQLEKQLKQAVREFVRNKIPVYYAEFFFVFKERQWLHIVIFVHCRNAEYGQKDK